MNLKKQFNYIYWKEKDTEEEIKVEVLETVIASCFITYENDFFKTY